MLDAPSPDAVRSMAARQTTILITVSQAKGSTPRISGTCMLVSLSEVLGTIGGGQLEFMAIDAAREMLASRQTERSLDVPLGPAIGQCCGGHVALDLEQLTPRRLQTLLALVEKAKADDPHVLIFGAGHVGRALARALMHLPVRAALIDTRSDELSLAEPGVITKQTALPESEVRSVNAGAAVVILTHDHALDFLIAREALARSDLAYVGMIGSKTKRATFASWLQTETGSRDHMAGLTMPIGASNLTDKRPAVIAAMVAAEVMEAVGTWEPTREAVCEGRRIG